MYFFIAVKGSEKKSTLIYFQFGKFWSREKERRRRYTICKRRKRDVRKVLRLKKAEEKEESSFRWYIFAVSPRRASSKHPKKRRAVKKDVVKEVARAHARTLLPVFVRAAELIPRSLPRDRLEELLSGLLPSRSLPCPSVRQRANREGRLSD